MSDLNSTNNSKSSQLTIFDFIDKPQYDLPLPEIIAQGGPDWNAFPLQKHDQDGKRFYSIQDWIKGIALTEKPRQFWNDMKDRFLKQNNKSIWDQVSALIRQLPYTATNNASYNMDYSTAEGLYLITQRMDTNTGIRDKVLAYLAKAGVIVDDYRLNPEQMVIDALDAIEAKKSRREQDLEKLENWDLGNSDAAQYLKDRIEGVEGFKSLMATIYQICDRPQPGKIINAEYVALFGLATKQLQVVLNTKQIRDKLPQRQYLYLRVAEGDLRDAIKQYDQITMDQLFQIVDIVVVPLGKHLQNICKRLNIHPVTGQSLLMDNVDPVVPKKQQLLLDTE